MALAAVVIATTASTASGAAPAAAPFHRPTGIALQFLGEQELPFGQQFDNTTVGGLSAISYDRRTNVYYLISDDRSSVNPARFYTAHIKFASSQLASVQLTGTHPWLRPDGTAFPPTAVATQTVAPDPEGIAVDPLTGHLLWTSEGERIRPDSAPATLGDPWVRESTSAGSYVGQLSLPPQLHMNSQPVGPRQNQTLEGISFTPDGRGLFSSMEDPLYQDGTDPTVTTGAMTRVTQYNPRTGTPIAQFAYPLSPFFTQPPVGDTTDTNGVSDILALGADQFLVLERASVYQNNDWKVRIYLARSSAATNVLSWDSLSEGSLRPMSKQLVLDLSDVPGLQRVDNVEGLTLGPRLPDGRRTLVLVSDNNFSNRQVTQFLAFAVTGI